MPGEEGGVRAGILRTNRKIRSVDDGIQIEAGAVTNYRHGRHLGVFASFRLKFSIMG